MPRPLMQLGVGQLEELFAKSKTAPKVLKQLEHELQFRQVPRAIALLIEVKAAMSGNALAASPVPAPAALPAPVRPLTPPLLQPTLWERSPAPSVASLADFAQARPPSVSSRESSVLQEPPAPDAPTLSVDEAYKVLRATSGSTWESIEQTRRQLVQQAYPSHVASLTTEKRAQAQADARRVNAAYAVLRATRAGHD